MPTPERIAAARLLLAGKTPEDIGAPRRPEPLVRGLPKNVSEDPLRLAALKRTARKLRGGKE